MKSLAEVQAACRQQHFARSTERVYCRWVEEYVRFLRERVGAWQHSAELGEWQTGYDICTVQELLGHKRVATTMFYTHVANVGTLAVRCPLDLVVA